MMATMFSGYLQCFFRVSVVLFLGVFWRTFFSSNVVFFTVLILSLFIYAYEIPWSMLSNKNMPGF